MTGGAAAGSARTSSGESELEVRRVMRHAPERVFDAWTDPRAMARWMRPRPGGDAEIELEAKVGGRVRIDMIHGDKRYRHEGEILELDRPRRLALTWVADWLPGGSLVTVDFTPVEGGTEVVLRHTGLTDAASAASHRAGWTAFLVEVDRHLTEGIGQAMWIDLTVPEGQTEAIRDFYDEVVGWLPEPVDMGGYSDYTMTDPADGTPRAGVCHAKGQNAEIPPVWVVYFRVVDLDRALESVTERGGSILSGPRKGGPTRYAIIRDPGGTVCALGEGG